MVFNVLYSLSDGKCIFQTKTILSKYMWSEGACLRLINLYFCHTYDLLNSKYFFPSSVTVLIVSGKRIFNTVFQCQVMGPHRSFTLIMKIVLCSEQ